MPGVPALEFEIMGGGSGVVKLPAAVETLPAAVALRTVKL